MTDCPSCGKLIDSVDVDASRGQYICQSCKLEFVRDSVDFRTVQVHDSDFRKSAEAFLIRWACPKCGHKFEEGESYDTIYPVGRGPTWQFVCQLHNFGCGFEFEAKSGPTVIEKLRLF